MTAFPLDAGPTAPAENTASGSPLASGPVRGGTVLGGPVLGGPVGDSPAPSGWRFLADAAATAALGAKLAALLPPGATLLLHGELGAGKTTLVQGLAAALGIDEPVTSPSFALAQHYVGQLSVGQLSDGRLNDCQLSDGRATALVHLDLYRLEDPASAAELFAQEEEEAQALGALLVVEWASRLASLPEPCWQLQLRLANAANPEAGRWAWLWGPEGACLPVEPGSASC
jgi:tRNA threonylcarbamoyladenosine biosynthesis protein TsaE